MCKDQLKAQMGVVRAPFESREGAADTVFLGGLKNQVKGVKVAAQVARMDAQDLGWLKEKATPLDPVAEKARIAAQETSASNARIAMQRRAMRENSLFSGGGAGGRSTLGV
jgi:hypothetical protein